MNAEHIYNGITDISEDYIKEAGAVFSGKGPALRKRKTIILLAAVLIFLLSACTIVYVATDWDEALIDHFHPSDVTVTQLQDAVQDVNVSSQCGDVLLTVRQVVGDTNTLYAVLGVTLPKDIDLRNYLSKDAPDEADIIPNGIAWYINYSADYSEIQGMSYIVAKEYMRQNGYWISSGAGLTTLQDVDFESNTLTFLLNLTSKRKEINNQPISIKTFWDILPLDQVASIQVGNYQIPVSHDQ